MPDRGPLTKYKVVFLGDEATGKTSLIRRYMYNNFQDKVESTIGMDFQSKNVQTEGGGLVRLQLWDTAGQERFRSLIPSYMRDASAAAITYDITNRLTFEACRKWLDSARESSESCILILIGNKLDLAAEGRQVQPEEGKELAKEYGIDFHEASAKSGENVSSIFTKVAESLAQANGASPAEEKAGAETGAPAATAPAAAAPPNEKGGFRLEESDSSSSSRKDKGCKC